jgi:hypothetical protein
VFGVVEVVTNRLYVIEITMYCPAKILSDEYLDTKPLKVGGGKGRKDAEKRERERCIEGR